MFGNIYLLIRDRIKTVKEGTYRKEGKKMGDYILLDDGFHYEVIWHGDSYHFNDKKEALEFIEKKLNELYGPDERGL
jgi:hypothetical protein